MWGQQELALSLEEALVNLDFSRKQWFEVKNIYMKDLFTDTQLLSNLDVNWWTGAMWIIVMFLSAVWTLILTAPIHYRGSIGEEILQICSDEETNATSWVAWEGIHLNFWMNCLYVNQGATV